MSSFPTLVDEADSPMSAPPKHPQLHPIWGKWGEPATIIVYGDSGIGKSTDMIYSFPTALFLSLPGAMKPSISTIGISKDDLWVVEVNNLDGAINAITRAAQLPPERRPVAVVVDDLTLLAERQAMDMKNSGNYQMVGDGVFRFWGDLRNKVQTLALYTRGIGAFPCFTVFGKADPSCQARNLSRRSHMQRTSYTRQKRKYPARVRTSGRASIAVSRKILRTT